MTEHEKHVIEYMDMRKEANERIDCLRQSIESISKLWTLQLTQLEYDLDALSYMDEYYQGLKIKQKQEELNKTKEAKNETL